MSIRRLHFVAVAAAAVLVLLSGCGLGAPRATPSGTERPATSPTPSPSPTPKATATADPADPATWIISETGAGPLKLGESRSQVLARVSARFPPSTTSCENDAVVFLGPTGTTGADAPFLLTTDGGADTARVVGVVLSDPGPRTTSGIGIGSTADDVRAAYPAAVESSRGGFVDQLVVHGDPGWITFQVDGDHHTGSVDLVSVIAGSEPPNEFCG